MTIALYLLLLATSFLYLPLFPSEEFETPKAFALITFACFSFALANYKNLLRDRVGLALSSFIVSMALSTIFSIDPYTSLWGNPKMPNGLLVWISYLVVYIIGLYVLRKKATRLSIIRLIGICSFVISCYAILQATGHDFKPWYNTVSEHGYMRPPSTLGHPNFMAAYLAMTTPFMLWMADKSPLKLERIAGVVVTLTSIVAIAFSQSRGMWWALLGGGLVYAWLKKPKIKYILSIAILGLSALGIGISASPKFVKGALERVGNIVSLGSTRIEYQKAAIRIWLKNPILGVGTDNFEIPFRNQRTPLFWHIQRDASPHRAHNEFLNVLATQGIIGFICGIFLTAAIFFKIRSSQSEFMIPATASVTAFYIQELSSFHCVATMMVLIISLCLLENKRTLT